MQTLTQLPFRYQEFLAGHPLSPARLARQLYHDRLFQGRIKKEEKAVANLERIIRSVLRLSQKYGYSAMSLRDLSRKTGLSMGGLYAYFDSKEDLLRMIFDCGQRTIQEIFDDLLPAFSEAEEKLKAAICAHLYLSEAVPEIFYFLFMEAKGLSSQNRRHLIMLEQSTESIFDRIIEEGIRERVFHTDHPLLAAAMIKALLQDWYLKRYKYVRRKVTVEEYAASILHLVIPYLKKHRSEYVA
jgi:AcrR family transcriptional regulator